MPTPADVFRGRPRTALTARPVDPTADRLVPAVTTTPPAALPDSAAFVTRYTAALLASDLHPNAKRVALLLADRANPRTGLIADANQLGARALASLSGLSDTPVRTSLNKLYRGGWLRRTRSHVDGRPAHVELCIPDHTRQPR